MGTKVQGNSTNIDKIVLSHDEDEILATVKQHTSETVGVKLKDLPVMSLEAAHEVPLKPPLPPLQARQSCSANRPH